MKNCIVVEFSKKKQNEIESLLANGCHVIAVDKNRFNIRDFKIQELNGDSLSYSATLCFNDKPLCKCVNTGNGGVTELTSIDARSTAVMASVRVRLNCVKYYYNDKEFDLTLDKIADFIADTLAKDAREKVLSTSTQIKLNSVK